MADSREVMNIRQASQYLGVSPDTLYKYVGEQKIPAFKLGNRWRFKKSKLDQWMEEKSNQMEAKSKRKPKAAVRLPGNRKRRAHVWIRIENDCWSGCGLLQHQGGGAEERAQRHRSRAPGPGSRWRRISSWIP